jgi:hypothetical protein
MARDARLSARVGVCVTMPEDLLARVDEILAGEQRLKIDSTKLTHRSSWTCCAPAPSPSG